MVSVKKGKSSKNYMPFALAAVVLALIIGSAVYFQYPQSERVVRIGYVEGIFNLHNWVAEDKGIFEKNGVKVELVKFQSSNQVADALLTNKIDVAGIMASEVIMSIEEKQPGSLSVFYCFTVDKENPFTNLVVRNESITKIDDLDGRKMAVFPGSMPQLLHKIVMKNIGSKAQITLVPLVPSLWLGALESGQVDAVLTFLPSEIIAEEKGVGRVLIPAVWETYVADPFVGSCAAFSSVFVKENPQLAKNVFVSVDEAVKFIENNDAEAKKIINSHLPYGENVVEKIKIQRWRRALEIENDIQKLINILYDGGILGKRIEARSILYQG